MQYGFCSLSLVSVRIAADNTSDLVTQLLFGEHFKVLEQRKLYSKIRKAFDASEGWVSNLQIRLITEEDYNKMQETKKCYAADLVSYIVTEKESLIPILLGSPINTSVFLNYTYDGNTTAVIQNKENLVPTSLNYLEAPFLSGGVSPFGLDSAGFTQMVYRINGFTLLRTDALQATQGEALSFIEECEPGDLAFFDNADGEINHVGILMQDNYIIHVDGKVRIDRIDHSGIFNTETGLYSHQLRVIKKIL